MALAASLVASAAAGGRRAGSTGTFGRGGAPEAVGVLEAWATGSTFRGYGVAGRPVHPYFFRGHGVFPDRLPAVKQFHFGHRPPLFGSPPVQVRIYEQYVPVPVYPGPLYPGTMGGMDSYRGAAEMRVHRGEGRGAVVHDPARERARASGVLEEREALRGVAHPPVARALEENAVGEASTWTDPRSGARSTVTPTRDLGGEERCREFRHSVAETGGELHSVGVACRARDGTWELLL
jgi:hypothetical protein